jgi:hypothetical protein
MVTPADEDLVRIDLELDEARRMLRHPVTIGVDSLP